MEEPLQLTEREKPIDGRAARNSFFKENQAVQSNCSGGYFPMKASTKDIDPIPLELINSHRDTQYPRGPRRIYNFTRQNT